MTELKNLIKASKADLAMRKTKKKKNQWPQRQDIWNDLVSGTKEKKNEKEWIKPIGHM